MAMVDDGHAALVLAAGDPLVDVSVTVDDDETITKLDERSGNPSFERGGCESVSGGQIGAILSAVREDLGLEPKVCAGGSASNLAKAIAMLRKQEGFEPNAAFFGCRGNDEDGAYFARELDECGVRTIGPIAENARTGTCLCLVSGQTGERTMRTCNGASALVCAEDWPPASSQELGLVGVDHVHAEGYYFRNPDLMRKILVTPTPKNATKSVDLASFELVRSKRDEIWALLAPREGDPNAKTLVDILFCNKDEAEAFVGERDLEVLSRLASVVVVSLGAEGCMAMHGGKTYRAPAPEIKVVDTTGAGDFFTAGFLHAYLKGQGIQEACEAACRAGAAACLQVGTDTKQVSEALRGMS